MHILAIHTQNITYETLKHVAKTSDTIFTLLFVNRDIPSFTIRVNTLIANYTTYVITT